MQYMVMCCFNERQWEDLPESVRDRIMQDYGAWKQNAVTSGHYRGGGKLQSTANATTIRERKGKPAITDGPFAETKEQLGGYHLIECENLDEAISIAKNIPTLPFGGTIEIRAVELL